jgi:hypothetical protein
MEVYGVDALFAGGVARPSFVWAGIIVEAGEIVGFYPPACKTRSCSNG